MISVCRKCEIQESLLDCATSWTFAQKWKLGIVYCTHYFGDMIKYLNFAGPINRTAASVAGNACSGPTKCYNAAIRRIHNTSSYLNKINIFEINTSINFLEAAISSKYILSRVYAVEATFSEKYVVSNSLLANSCASTGERAVASLAENDTTTINFPSEVLLPSMHCSRLNLPNWCPKIRVPTLIDWWWWERRRCAYHLTGCWLFSPTEVSALIEDLAENSISIIYFEETATSKNLIEVYNDAVPIFLIGKYSIKPDLRST